MSQVLHIMKYLDNNETMYFEQLFRYKMNEADEQKYESIKVAKEYYMS